MQKIILSIWLLPWVSGSPAASSEPVTLSGSIEPRASFKSAPLSLAQGDRIDVAAQGPPELSLDVYVYTDSGHELAAKSDDDAEEPFEWTVGQTSRYYVVLRNASGVSGRYRIRISKPEGRTVPETPPNAALIKVFYATDRIAVQQHTPRGTVYGGEPASQLQLGLCEVTIPRSHEMGELEGPSVWKLEFREDASKHVLLLRTVPEDATRFFHQLSNRVNLSTAHEALIFVHGFNTNFETGVRRTAQIAYDLGFEGAVILYSWPSQGQLGLIDYNKDARNAELSVAHFSDFVSNLATHTGVRRIHVIAHSMGNRVVVRALAASPSPTQPRVRQLALLAPDVDAEEFRRLASAMKSSADHITLYASSRDEALKASERLEGYPRAGEGEPHVVVVPGIDTVDASAVNTSLLGLYHSYFGDNQTILSDLFYLLRDALPGQRARLRALQSSAGTYWIFLPAAR
jgi:esterase/lipase superfamily enzyme